MTLTEAVNLCLSGVGIAPISTADEIDSNLDAAFGYQKVMQASRDIQAKGWWFNRESKWFLTPDLQGHIKRPNQVMSVSAWAGSRDADLTIRGDYIYDRISHGIDLTDLVNADGKIEFQFIMHLDFEDLPPIAQNAIAYRARRLNAADDEGDTSRIKFTGEDEAQALAVLYSTETRNRKDNMFQNPTARHALSNMGGQNARITAAFPKASKEL